MKRVSMAVMAVLSLFVLSGCLVSTEEESRYHVYYLNKEKTKIVEENYTPESLTAEEMIVEFIELIHKEAESVEYQRILPQNVRVVSYNYDGNQLSLYFNEAYSAMEVAEEVLCRAAIVRTMVQIPRVTCVSFYIGDTPLTDQRGNVVGLMTNESFVENPGEQINSIQTASIALYFANSTGDGLVMTTEEVSYITNISMEKLVMEHLLEGPHEEGMMAAIPSGTKLVSVTTTNGTCYVNLDEGFLNQVYEVQEPIVIYSIVDSLSEIPGVSRVQISVNGNTTGIYRDTFAFDTLYERNLDYVVGKEEANTEVKESEEPFE